MWARSNKQHQHQQQRGTSSPRRGDFNAQSNAQEVSLLYVLLIVSVMRERRKVRAEKSLG